MSFQNLSSSPIISSQNDDILNTVIKWINIFYPIVLSLSSIAGNMLSFVIFSSKVFENNASGFFLKLKSLVDMVNVCLGTLRFTYQGLTDIDIKNSSKFSCYFLNIAVYTIDAFSSWLTVFVSFDRLILVYRPSFYKSLIQKKLFRYQLLVVLLSFFILATIHTLKPLSLSFTQTLKSNKSKEIVGSCTAKNRTLVDLTNSITTLIIPFVLMAISSSIFIYQLIKSKTRMNKYRQNRIVVNNTNKRNMIIIKTVLCLDICFLVFNFPRFLLQYMKEQYFKNNDTLYALLLQLSTVLKYSYCSLSIFFYLANNLFRERLKELFYNDLNVKNFFKR